MHPQPPQHDPARGVPPRPGPPPYAPPPIRPGADGGQYSPTQVRPPTPRPQPARSPYEGQAPAAGPNPAPYSERPAPPWQPPAAPPRNSTMVWDADAQREAAGTYGPPPAAHDYAPPPAARGYAPTAIPEYVPPADYAAPAAQYAAPARYATPGDGKPRRPNRVLILGVLGILGAVSGLGSVVFYGLSALAVDIPADALAYVYGVFAAIVLWMLWNLLVWVRFLGGASWALYYLRFFSVLGLFLTVALIAAEVAVLMAADQFFSYLDQNGFDIDELSGQDVRGFFQGAAVVLVVSTVVYFVLVTLPLMWALWSGKTSRWFRDMQGRRR